MIIKNLIRLVIKFIIVLPIHFIEKYINFFSKLHPSISNMIYSLSLQIIDKRKTSIDLGSGKNIKFYTPNSICKMRADTFFTKEPETLEWIEKFSNINGSKNVLIDIGANIGTYSLFNSVKFGNKSILFEPSPLNLKQLFKNINLNKVSNLCHVATIPLNDSNTTNIFNLSSLDDGGALSGFGVDYGYDGNTFISKASMSTIGITLDKYLELFSPIKSNEKFIIKLDVDGIEHLILKGGLKTLKNKNCLSVLVEVNTDFDEQKNKIDEQLLQCDFKLGEKRQSDTSKNSNLFKTSFNYIYYKN